MTLQQTIPIPSVPPDILAKKFSYALCDYKEFYVIVFGKLEDKTNYCIQPTMDGQRLDNIHYYFKIRSKEQEIIAKNDQVYHVPSGLYQICENKKHEGWMNSNRYFIKANKIALPPSYHYKDIGK